MDHQKFRADYRRAIQFPAEGRNRPGANFGIARSQIDEVIDVDYQGVDIVFPANRLQRRNLRRVRHPRPPHTWTRRENLQRLGADFDRPRRCFFKRAKCVKVNTQPQIYILPTAVYRCSASHTRESVRTLDSFAEAAFPSHSTGYSRKQRLQTYLP